MSNVRFGISMNNSELEQVKYCKYLGVILDCKISWVQHIAYVKSKISKGVGKMYQARKYLDRNSLVYLYNSYIYPYFIYCVESWGNVANCHFDPLYILHKKFCT